MNGGWLRHVGVSVCVCAYVCMFVHVWSAEVLSYGIILCQTVSSE